MRYICVNMILTVFFIVREDIDSYPRERASYLGNKQDHLAARWMFTTHTLRQLEQLLGESFQEFVKLDPFKHDLSNQKLGGPATVLDVLRASEARFFLKEQIGEFCSSLCSFG